MLKTLDDDLVMGLVDQALNQPSPHREAYLRSACDGDTALFEQVWGYVEMEVRMSGFLQRPALDYLLEAFPDGVFAGQPVFPDEAFLSGQPFQAGERVAERFRIIRHVAEGGMGIVYEAVDERLQRRIAIKCAKDGFGSRLPPEVRHASEISHPNVCKIFDIHTASTARGDVEFLTMEFLDGKTLAERLRAGPLAASEIGAIATQLCAGLAEAHRKRVIHGDLKSNNVILTAVQGTVRAVITDFGLARKPPGSSTTGDRGNTLQSAPAAGARDYMAPELWKGAKPTTASDVYALGVILCELTSGKRPGVAVDAGRPSSIPKKWNGVIARCLDPEPARRFEDAGSLAKALSPRHTRRWVLAGIAAVLMAGVSGVVSFQRAMAPQQTVRLALQPFQPGEHAAQIAARLTSEAALRLAGLRGNSRVKLIFLPVSGGLDPGATQVLHGTVDIENGDVALHAYITDTHSGVNTKEFAALYRPAEIRYAPAAIAAVVTSALHLPPIMANATVNAAARKDYVAGLSYVRRNVRQKDAVAALERAVAADPDSPVARAGLAEAQFSLYLLTHDAGWKARAQDSVRQAELRNLDIPEVHVISGLLKANSSLYGPAQLDYERAIEIQPVDGDAYRRLSAIYNRDTEPGEAFAAIKKAIEVQPDDFRNYQQLGTLYIRRGDYRAALPAFQKMVTLEPALAETHFALGAALEFLGMFGEAETELRAALRLQDSSVAEEELGTILLDLRRNREAVTCLLRAVEIGPETPELLMDLGLAYSREGEAREANVSFRKGLASSEKILMRDPREGSERARLAYLAARLGDPKRAASEIGQALRISPEDSETLTLAVLVYELLGHRQQSLDLLAGSPSARSQLSRYFELDDLRRDPRFQLLSGASKIH